MLTRSISLSLIGLAFAFTAFVFDAASSANHAAQLIESARNARSDAVRALTLQRAEEALTGSWAQPLAWHAGAMELQSGVDALAAGTDEDPASNASMRWAEQSLSAAPVQPLAWLRLATLSRAGRPNTLCEFTTCLARSWRTGPVLERDSACMRLALTAQTDTDIAADDPRVAAFIATHPNAREIARCLSFLPPEDQFRLMLLARERVVLRRQARQARPRP